jgi:hypothetical protein
MTYGSASSRMKDRELILRFFALYHADLTIPTVRARERMDAGEYPYARPMKEFLNRYCQLNGNLQWQTADELTKLFHSSISLIARTKGQQAFRPGKALNAAVFDGVMVGLARRLRAGPVESIDEFKEAYEQLLRKEEFVEVYSRATADYESVKTRVELATRAFANVS